MPPSDIYAPPAASVAGPTPAELSAKSKGEVVLAGIGQRIGASLIDGLLFTPLYLLGTYISTLSRVADIATGAVSLIIVLLFFVATVRLYGGTPGKLMLGMRVTMADGGRVTWKAAFLRYSVYFGATVALSVGELIAVLAIPEATYLSGYLARSAAVSAQTPAWVMPVNFFTFAWAIASFISLLVTQQRRTLYDFQAGTIVVRPV